MGWTSTRTCPRCVHRGLKKTCHAGGGSSAGGGDSACGGGVSQVDRFTPDRVLAFGDEHSLLTAGGRRYAINGLAADGSTVDCEANPIWVQTLASVYGFKFSQCPGTATEFKAKCLALLEEVGSGDCTLTITKRGKAVAQVVRPATERRYPKLGGALEGLLPPDFDHMRDFTADFDVVTNPDRVLNPEKYD